MRVQPWVYVCILFQIVSFSSYAGSKDAEDIKQVYEKYRYSILNDDGKQAFLCVDSRTKKYYGQLLQWALKDDSTTLEQHSLVDKFTVLAIRAKASKEEILSFDSSGLFIYAVNHGMVGKNGVANQKIAEPVMDSTFAKTNLIVNEKESSIALHYYKEENEWKIDITHLLPMASASLRNMVDESGMTENEFIMDLLRILEGHTPKASIWLPLTK